LPKRFTYTNTATRKKRAPQSNASLRRSITENGCTPRWAIWRLTPSNSGIPPTPALTEDLPNEFSKASGNLSVRYGFQNHHHLGPGCRLPLVGPRAPAKDATGGGRPAPPPRRAFPWGLPSLCLSQ